MRSDLKAKGVAEIATDLDEQTCTFKLDANIDVKEWLDALAEDNNKISGWTLAN